MNKFYKLKYEPNKHYLIKICSLEKRYIYYRNNFKRVCIENYKLKQENEKLKEKLHEKNKMMIELNKILES